MTENCTEVEISKFLRNLRCAFDKIHLRQKLRNYYLKLRTQNKDIFGGKLYLMHHFEHVKSPTVSVKISEKKKKDNLI